MGKAPKKAAGGGGGGLDANEAVILKYLQNQNRPYSAVDVFNNLHGKIGKAAVVKALTVLVEKGEISGKAYGKQWVYVARQDTLSAPSPQELDELDQSIDSLKQEINAQKDKVKSCQLDLDKLKSSMTNEEIAERMNYLRTEIGNAEKRLQSLRSGTRKVDPVEKAKVDKSYELYAKEWKIRKRMCMEMINAITENMSKPPSAFIEELGLETDPTNKS